MAEYVYDSHQGAVLAETGRVFQPNEWWKLFPRLSISPGRTKVADVAVLGFCTVTVHEDCDIPQLDAFMNTLASATIVYDGTRQAFDIIIPMPKTSLSHKIADCATDVARAAPPRHADLQDRILIYPENLNNTLCVYRYTLYVSVGDMIYEVRLVRDAVGPRYVRRMYFVSKQG